MRARVYFNLHKRLWSVQLKNAKGRWYVAFHASTLELEGVRWTVSEAGRQRVLREKRKNVHAFCAGTLMGMWGARVARDLRNVPTLKRLAEEDVRSPHKWEPVRYNPFQMATFEARGEPLHKSEHAFLAEENKKALVFACLPG